MGGLVAAAALVVLTTVFTCVFSPMFSVFRPRVTFCFGNGDHFEHVYP